MPILFPFLLNRYVEWFYLTIVWKNLNSQLNSDQKVTP